jgi:26S proteasome regulatory subunit N6
LADISQDPVISHHVRELNERLIEQNLCRIVEPYSRVEIEHVAKLAKLPIERVHSKLGDMILDKKLNATLDQGIGALMTLVGIIWSIMSKKKSAAPADSTDSK